MKHLIKINTALLLGVLASANGMDVLTTSPDILANVTTSSSEELLNNADTTTTDLVSKKPRVMVKKRLKRRRIKFSPEEDAELKTLVVAMGDHVDWSEAAKLMSTGRTGRQCRERYTKYLSEDIDEKQAWTPEEDRNLSNLVRYLGTKWDKMPWFFGNKRSSNELKARWFHLQKFYQEAENKPLRTLPPEEKERLKEEGLWISEYINAKYDVTDIIELGYFG